MKPIRIVLAEDHRLMRAGLRALLLQLDGVTVVGEAQDGREALRVVKAHKPDVVLMDIAMPELNGIDATSRIAQDLTHVHVIMLSMHANEEYIWRALRAGAKGYLLKEADEAELELALRAVVRGQTYLTPAVAKYVADEYLRHATADSDQLDALSPRQREILQLLAEGRSTKAIAHRLHLSAKTVEWHRAQLMQQLGIYDLAGLVRFAIRTGLVLIEPPPE